MEQDIKKQIVGILEKDCRLSAEEIAVMLGKEIKEVELAIKELEKEGILCGYHALVNWDKVDAPHFISLMFTRSAAPICIMVSASCGENTLSSASTGT